MTERDLPGNQCLKSVSILQKYDYDIVAISLPVLLLMFQFYKSTIMTLTGKIYQQILSLFQFYKSTIMTWGNGNIC